MERRTLRQLEVWLPEDHPIFRVPVEKRAEIARLLLSLSELFLDLLERVERLEKRVEKIEAKEEGAPEKQSGFSNRDKKNRVEIDPAAFLDI
ncbi:hypothetical protein [Ammonifex thiophilus]|uniref:Uncharacterized protein n=1 Tax=Ammonifex thiophilus TaxID=444093 RepID=A0A3D8P273_9THEO|nr:hypothetical protein [Ammonifex thiophilus]RDV80891.1 hypothetical protein DXX99_10280 [Ammonifex thiophilus]